MSKIEPKQLHNTESDDLFEVVADLADKFSTFETFVSRRFDEISMEINATSQQVDLAEEGIARRFGEILEVLHSISFSGDGNTPANAGVELDAVVEMTEMAANRILDAADRIAGKIHGELQGKIDVEDIDKDIEEIFLACSFQDITGQRIRKTLENLKTIEDRLGSALDKMGITVDMPHDHTVIKAKSQEEVDDIFKNKTKPASY